MKNVKRIRKTSPRRCAVGKSRTCETCDYLNEHNSDSFPCNRCIRNKGMISDCWKSRWQPKPKPGKVFLDMEVKVDKTLPRGTIKMLDKNGKELVRMINVGVDKSK